MITLKTLPEATEQQVFDQVANHLLTQAEKCENDRGDCVYKNNEGLECAAGCLIADDEYQRIAMERRGWKALMDKGVVPKEHGDLIMVLQDIHDYSPAESWFRVLNKLAKQRKLDVSALHEAAENNFYNL